MTILHIVDVKNAKGNGVAEAVKKYIQFESVQNDVYVYFLDDVFETVSKKQFLYTTSQTIEDIVKQINHDDLIIVFNEVYKPKYIKLYKECLKFNIPYVIIPHGCLVTDAQNKKKIKKVFGNIFLFNSFIKNASAIQFLNDREEKQSNFKYKKSIICGNGIVKSNLKNDCDNKNKDFIFIGRYDIQTKGLDLLANICKNNKDWFINNNIKIQLFGRTSGNDMDLLKELINKLEIEDVLKVNGPLYGKDKEEMLLRSYAFIQTSRHEGQPIGILEALSYGVPCVVTYGTSFGEYINENHCGLASEFDENEVFENIKKLVSNEELRKSLSSNAYNCVNKDYDWTKVIEKTTNEYKKIISANNE